MEPYINVCMIPITTSIIIIILVLFLGLFCRRVTSRRRSLRADCLRYVPIEFVTYRASSLRAVVVRCDSSFSPCTDRLSLRAMSSLCTDPVRYVQIVIRYAPTVTYRSLRTDLSVPFPFRATASRRVCRAVLGTHSVVIGTSGIHGTHPEVIRTEK